MVVLDPFFAIKGSLPFFQQNIHITSSHIPAVVNFEKPKSNNDDHIYLILEQHANNGIITTTNNNNNNNNINITNLKLTINDHDASALLANNHQRRRKHNNNNNYRPSFIPIDITEFVHNEGQNTMQFSLSAFTNNNDPNNNNNNSEFVVSLFIGSGGMRSVDELAQSVPKRTVLPRDLSASATTTNDDHDDDMIEMISSSVSLVCPLTCGRISDPVRGSRCTHLQCFDLRGYLIHNERHHEWTCPVCCKPAPLDELYRDELAEEMLRSCRGDATTSFRVHPDGTYEEAILHASATASESAKGAEVMHPILLDLEIMIDLEADIEALEETKAAALPITTTAAAAAITNKLDKMSLETSDRRCDANQEITRVGLEASGAEASSQPSASQPLPTVKIKAEVKQEPKPQQQQQQQQVSSIKTEEQKPGTAIATIATSTTTSTSGGDVKKEEEEEHNSENSSSSSSYNNNNNNSGSNAPSSPDLDLDRPVTLRDLLAFKESLIESLLAAPPNASSSSFSSDDSVHKIRSAVDEAFQKHFFFNHYYKK